MEFLSFIGRLDENAIEKAYAVRKIGQGAEFVKFEFYSFDIDEYCDEILLEIIDSTSEYYPLEISITNEGVDLGSNVDDGLIAHDCLCAIENTDNEKYKLTLEEIINLGEQEQYERIIQAIWCDHSDISIITKDDLAIDEDTEHQEQPRKSAFEELGFKETIQMLQEEICRLYAEDDSPWIIGYSGGKDSTAILQLIWTAISSLPVEQRKKIVYVISTDTMVENPIVATWVSSSLAIMKQAAIDQEMPIEPRGLHPAIADSFWVNLIGRGYPAPRHKFRWCTERLKISPSNTFINERVSSSGEAILVLGTRKAESSARAANMARHEKGRVRDRLSPNSRLPGSLVYTPIEDWTNDDVWFYLMQVKNPWGYNNRDLLGMYAGASADGECPLVVDDSTPSCGDSRFGCWVCTLVDKDKSMTAMIQNDEEKEWMMPLLDIRDALDFRRDHEGNYAENADYDIRDFRRMTGSVQVMADGRPIHGPYIQSAREEWLKRLLTAQFHIRKNGPPEVHNIELITLDELQEIRRIWLVEKHELEDSLPRIYREATGIDYPGRALDDNLVIGEEEMAVLAELCGDDRLHYELTRELLSITRQQRSTARRAGLHETLEKTFIRHFYDSKEDAISRAQQISERKKSILQNKSQHVSVVMESSADKKEAEV